MVTFDDGLDALHGLIAWLEQHPESPRNEASTRFHLIDRLVKDCLGWPPEEIQVERHHDRSYTDYEFGRPGAQFVLEAKREDVTFDLPAERSGRFRLKSARSSSEDLREAIDQATGYAQARGIPIAAVSNGEQLVVFLGSRSDGVPPSEGECIVFSSLLDMRDRFNEVWDLCSRAGVNSRRALVQLQRDSSLPSPPSRLSQRLQDYPGNKNRNPVGAELQILGGAFIEDIPRNPDVEREFLETAYCASGALSQYALVAREVLQTRYSAFFDKEFGSSQSATGKKGISDEFVQDVLAAALSQRPIVLLGDVGVGKTTFIRRLVNVDAAEVMQHAIELYVDFGREPTLAGDLRPYVRNVFIEQLRENYGLDIDQREFVRGVYHADLQRFANGIFADLAELEDKTAFRIKEIEHLESLTGDRDAHLQRSLSHIQKAHRRQVVVFLDNVDQRSSDFQDDVFLISESMAATWPVTVFVALRPETFQRSKVEGALSGYQPRVFTIEPPRIDRVLQKRIAFARHQLATHGSLPSFPAGVTLQSERLDLYLGMLEQALHQNSDLISFIENMSCGSVRRALELVSRFVGSGHVNNEKIMEILERSGRYHLPLHEVMRAVAIGDHEHYDPASSPVPNVFDITSDDGTEHFLLLNMLGYLLAAGGAEEGYVSTSMLYHALQALGFRPVQIDAAISRAIRFRLLETYPRVLDVTETREAIRARLTTAGAYAVKELVSRFAYVDIVIVDTPIVDPSVREKVQDERTITSRLLRCRRFLTYLDRQHDLLVQRGAISPFDWAGAKGKLLDDIQKVERKNGIEWSADR